MADTDLDESRLRGVPRDPHPHHHHPSLPPTQSGDEESEGPSGADNGHSHNNGWITAPAHHVPQHHTHSHMQPIISRQPRRAHEVSPEADGDLDGERSGLQAAAAKTALFIRGTAQRSSLDGDVVTTEADDDDQSSHWIFRRHVEFSEMGEPTSLRRLPPSGEYRGEPHQNGGIHQQSTKASSTKDHHTLQSERTHLLGELRAIRQQRQHLRGNVSSPLSQHFSEWNLRLSSAQQSHQTALSKLEELSAKRIWTEEEYQMACKWHVLGDAFCIWHRGPFGTINGFRLGKSATTMAGLVKKCAGGGGGRDLGAGQAGNGGGSPGKSIFSWGAADNAVRTSPQTTSPPNQPEQSNGNAAKTNAAAPEKVVVPWNEINSALGQIVFLLHTLQNAPHSGISFQKHAFQLSGSASKIGVLKKNTTTSPQRPRNERRRITALAAYMNTETADATTTPLPALQPTPPASQSTPLPGEVTWYNLHHYEENGSVLSMGYYARRNFNTALEGLLYCIAEASLVVEKRDMALAAPYIMRVDGLVVGKDAHGREGIAPTKDGDATVGELPLAYDPAAGEQWTMVCKYLLTNLKWLIAFAAKHVDR